ncbi:unnamed protein product, partial [Didymodactylos carnosus]
MDSRRTPSR